MIKSRENQVEEYQSETQVEMHNVPMRTRMSDSQVRCEYQYNQSTEETRPYVSSFIVDGEKRPCETREPTAVHTESFHNELVLVHVGRSVLIPPALEAHR
jgi:hypothetical protein